VCARRGRRRTGDDPTPSTVREVAKREGGGWGRRSRARASWDEAVLPPPPRWPRRDEIISFCRRRRRRRLRLNDANVDDVILSSLLAQHCSPRPPSSPSPSHAFFAAEAAASLALRYSNENMTVSRSMRRNLYSAGIPVPVHA